MTTVETGAAVASLDGLEAAKDLNDWYERNVGYRPQIDCPAMTDGEVYYLCLGVAAEMDAHGDPPR